MNFFFILGLFLSFLFSCAVHWISRIPITSQNANKKNEKSKIQTPKSRSKSVEACLPYTCVCPTRVSAHPSAQQLRPQRLKHLNPPLPFILMKKLGCLPHIFSCFSCHQSCGVFFLCRSLDFPSHPKMPPKKKSREFPLGGPSPCGKQD